jgi:uncharacterized protein YbaP (TraB family)
MPVLAIGQSDQSLLWKVTRPDSDRISYLFGSMHTNDSLANSFSESWWNAFNQCNVLAAEVDLVDTTDAALVLQAVMMKDTVLSDLYTDENFKIVKRLIEKEFDPFYASMLNGIKPFYILALIMEKPQNNETFETVMDVRVQLLAREMGKDVIGLETASEQASSIDVLNLKEQAELLLNYAKSTYDATDYFERLKGFYLDQNLDSLIKEDVTAFFPEKLVIELVEGRNRRFFQSLVEQIPHSNVFGMVGAMHLPGENGLVAMLRREGYLVEPVRFYFGKK